MKRILIVVPLLLVGTFIARPDETEETKSRTDITMAEQVEMNRSARIVDSWTEEYVQAMTLEGEAQETLRRLSREIEATTLPYEDESTERLKERAESVVDKAVSDMQQQSLSEGYQALESLKDGYEVNR